MTKTETITAVSNEDGMIDGTKFRNREFILNMFEEAIKHKAYILERTRQAVLDHGNTLPALIDKVDEDVALRAHIMAAIADLIKGAEGVYTAMTVQGGFQFSYTHIKEGYLKHKELVEKEGATPV